jgi:signal transduction histidine kinase
VLFLGLVASGVPRFDGRSPAAREPYSPGTKAIVRESIKKLEQLPKPVWVAAALGLLLLIGLVDYVTGFWIVFSVFYLLNAGLAAWYVSRGFGIVISVLSGVVWIGGDVAAGAPFPSPFVPIWNTLILITSCLMVAWLLASLRTLHRELESRVAQRTQALRREMTERQRLEEEILKVSETEQRRIGHELHDGLCQHLTATALAGQVLGERLAAKSLPEAGDANKVVELVEEGISMARNFARGLYPVEMEAEGLMDAFQELANSTTRGAKVSCVFDCTNPVLIHDDTVATHLYRIAYEAIRNAIRHGKPNRIGISLSEEGSTLRLSIEDDGVGLPETKLPGGGLGIRIMAYRAGMIGGTLTVEPAPTGGTIVTCTLPRKSS